MRATHEAARSLIACAVSRSIILFHSCHSIFGALLTLGDRLQNQFQTLGHVILDDMLGHPQPLGDFPLRQPLDLAKLEYPARSEEHTSELQSLMRISYAVFCLKKKKKHKQSQIKPNKYNNHTST